MRNLWFVLSVVLVAALMVAGCSKGKGQETGKDPYIYSATPEAQVEAFLKLVNAGEYEKAAAYLNNGPAFWQTDPALVKSSIDRMLHGAKAIETFTLRKDAVVKSDTATLTYDFTYVGGNLGWAHFDLVKRGKGWIIVEFV